MPDWDELFGRGEHLWRDPHPAVVSLGELVDVATFPTILDLGCGAGRHAVYLGGLGFSVVGLDPAVNGLRIASSRLAAKELPTRLAMGTMCRLPFTDETMDGVVSIYVLHHGTLAEIGQAVSEIERVLVPGGLLFLLILAADDWKFGKGTCLEEGTYLTNVGDETGVSHHFFHEEEVRCILRRFDLVELEKEMVSPDWPAEPHVPHRHWQVLARKRIRRTQA